MNSKYLIAAALGAAAFLLSRKSSAASFEYDGVPNTERYLPHSPEAKALFAKAAAIAGLPESWATEPEAHNIMAKESGGWVGRPNYTYGKVKSPNSRGQWPGVWAKTRSVARQRRAQKKNVSMGHSSSATGLGQLLALPIVHDNGKISASNVEKFYPDGLDGIGDPINEAVGFLRYIAARYGSPDVAYQMYGKTGSYVHASTGKKRSKTFKEGY